MTIMEMRRNLLIVFLNFWEMKRSQNRIKQGVSYDQITKL